MNRRRWQPASRRRERNAPTSSTWTVRLLASVIFTSIARDATLKGPDRATLKRVRAMTSLPAGPAAVLLGKARYEGRIKLADALAQ